MSKQSHTAGPCQKVRGELRGSNGEKVVEYGSGLAIMCGGNPDPEHVANARLIAAAPELLEALKLAVDLVDRDVIQARPSEREELIAAIAAWNTAIDKATGDDQ